ncbi:MAG: serine/threonine protein kinase [Acidobacteria bacterium]|nr:serine/threonine protein kinase [Acidobacteriota bacterium]
MDDTPELKQRRIAFDKAGSSKRKLPSEFASMAARRVGIAGLTFSVCYLGFEILFHFTRANQAAGFETFFLFTTAVGIASGLLMFWISRRMVHQPEQVIRIGLVFLVLTSMQIGLAEGTVPFTETILIRGHSAIAMWIGVFSLLAPAPYRQSLIAALCAAAMAPLGIAFNVWLRGYAAPPLAVWFMWSTAPFLMALTVTWLAQWAYQLGAELEKAREMGSYQLLEPIGQGGMGEVWKARHRFLARDAAVKLIHQKHSDTPTQLKRFEREARIIAKLECPHTVSIFDFGSTPAGELYFAMELIRGLNLDQLVHRFGPQSASRVKHIWTGVLKSLAEAHNANLTHRDIKPSNILLSRPGLEHDFVKVVDFGLAKAHSQEEQTQLTMDSTTVGTPAYMAPQLAEGNHAKVDGRADLYALGCVVYFLLTGKTVFEAPTPMALILKHI